ncbi:hypothetical protein LCGC14_0739440 [marine sediment metagenome]|uniref:Uncharacterized protein n=1 Tax=marine sediment metagenome TaxID=412755 RepID=A0A0F9QS76_9ZZZZ
MIPKYKHDCKDCIFLGNYNNHDLYSCWSGSSPTVVARYGNEGSDYHSGLIFRVRYEELAVAATIVEFRISVLSPIKEGDKP